MNKKYITLAVSWAYFHTKRLLALHKAFINVLFYCLYTKWVYVRIPSFSSTWRWFFIFLPLDNISQYPLFLDDINWTKFVFQCSMQIFYGERKPLKFVSPNIIYIYLLSSSDKFSKKLVDKQISMDEYFMLKVLCKEGWHKSFIIYELEADTKVAVILSETLLEDVMIFMYQIHLI